MNVYSTMIDLTMIDLSMILSTMILNFDTMILSTLILYSTMIDLTMILYVDDAFFIFTWSGDTTNRVVWELRSDQQIQQPAHKHSNQPTIALAV